MEIDPKRGKSITYDRVFDVYTYRTKSETCKIDALLSFF